MFVDKALQNHLESSSTIKVQSLVVAEWNMNVASDIAKIGNYRFRQNDGPFSKYQTLPSSYDPLDSGYFYTNATDADVTIDGGLANDDESLLAFTLPKEKEQLIYSLESCFSRFRPRSGINKLRYFSNQYTHHTNPNMMSRPRYYMGHKDDQFKYWSSYRTETDNESTQSNPDLRKVNVERGIANKTINGQHYIDDAAPFVVYSKDIPSNRIIIKMQTNVGTVDLGPFSKSSGTFPDPLFGDENKTTPLRWQVQYLKNNTWVDAISFNQLSSRRDGSAVIGPDGYVELAYGLIIPEQYYSIFKYAGTFSSDLFLPRVSNNGDAYLVSDNDSLGTYYIWIEELQDYESFSPQYGWYLKDDSDPIQNALVNDLTNPSKFLDQINGGVSYREFEYISGLRLVVQTMNKPGSILDLIELSPRLVVNLTDKVKSFDIKKSASDLGISGLPVGELLASTGNLSLFDYDQSFNENNTSSIVSNYLMNNIQLKFYESIIDVDGIDYTIPIKAMYADGFPKMNSSSRTIDITMRDMFFHFESINAPEILIPDASLSYVLAMIFDSIGFSNYVYKKVSGEPEPIIPFFFVAPDTSVAETLNQLARSTQTVMFFDEYNNFVCMSKNYMLPSETDRGVDIVLNGSADFIKNGVVENQTTSSTLSNIIDISSQDNHVYNDGRIAYTERYIQKTYGSLKQASLVDMDKTWIYKPVLLWEVAPSLNTKSINSELSTQSSFVLGAMALKTDLTDSIPVVLNNQIRNNIIDFGENVYWITRYNGYFYANGEIIKYDAVEYAIPGVEKYIYTNTENGQLSTISETVGAIGNVWITSVQEYQRYFAKLPFNGKMYPTGRVRIYSEPNYEVVNGVTRIKNGPVAKHGRGQFGTTITNHAAGLSSYWSDNANVRGCSMDSSYIFTSKDSGSTTVAAAGVSNDLAAKTTRNGIIKNFLSSSYVTETEANKLLSTQSGTVQSSALVMNGPSFSTKDNPADFVSYVYRPLNNKFTHFGTRTRIIGRIENNDTRGQTPIGSTPYFIVPGSSPNQSVNIGGASGGIAVLINPETNVGYYFEIAALTENNINNYEDESEVANIFFYKIMKGEDSSKAIPVKLWSGLSQIIVDDGKFVGQGRLTSEQNTTVYDLAVEYQDIGGIRRFYLYINNKVVAVVDDKNPLPVYSNLALFVRGSSRMMFENVYAISNNYSQNTSYLLDTPINSVFGDSEININESFRKYAMSGMIQSTYLAGINATEPPKYNIYFEEFGTIMREAAYFNIKYDKAYPAIYATLSPTFNKVKGYVVSGFLSNAYGAEFLIFNATDSAINLDETSGNYLRIQGVTFTQQSNNELTVDDYFSKKSNFADPQISNEVITSSPIKYKKDYEDIKLSRMTYGKKEFSLDAPYIQSQDAATDMMAWITSKIMKPRKSVGVKVFGMPTIQLGDIVKINFNREDVDQVANPDSRFVVYHIEHQRALDEVSMSIFLSEVV